jgi:periplasmic mercuric ion binding protein
MKRKSILTLFLMFSFCVSMFAQQRSSMTIYFTTLGNCGICQNRIQNAVKYLPGIDTVYWNIPKKQTTVTYDESVTNPYTIMHAIANVGHDNEWFRAPDSAYNLLIGSCCEYQRTIDYDTVKVGYLGMMGIWIYPLGVHKIEQKDFLVTPTIGNGLFQVSVMGSQAPENIELSVYSLKGIKILSAESVAGSIHSVDLRSFPNGQYLVVISDKTRIISSARVIKAE